MENKGNQNLSQLYHFTSNVQLKQESQSQLPTDSNSDSNQLENIPENSQSQQTNTTSHVHPQLQSDYEYSTIDSLSNQYLLSQQQRQQSQPQLQSQSQLPPACPPGLSVQSNTQTSSTYPQQQQQQQQQQVIGTPPQGVPALLNLSTSTPQLNSSSSVPPPTSIQQQQYQNYSTATTNIHDELSSSSRSNPGYELRHSHSFPTTRSFYQTTMQPPPLPPPPPIQDFDIQGSSSSILQSPQPSLHHGGTGVAVGGFYVPPTQPSVPSSLVSSANTSTSTIATTSNPTTTVGGSSSTTGSGSGSGSNSAAANVPSLSFSVPTHLDVNEYPDMTTFVNSNTNIVVPLVEHRFVDNKVCVICGKKITRDMSRHMRTHQSESRFNCKFPKNQCHHKSGKFNRPYDFKKHLLNRHFKFDDPSIKRLHNLSDKLNHWGTCPCGLRFIGKDWLDDHILTDDLTKKCPFID